VQSAVRHKLKGRSHGVCGKTSVSEVGYITDCEPPDRRVKSVCISFLASRSSDRSTPQKLSCGSSDSMPARSSFGPSCRMHRTRNSAFFDPRCKLMIIPGCNCVRRPPSCAPVVVMSTVCARRVTLSTETLTGNTIFLRCDLRLFSIGSTLLSDVNPSSYSYLSQRSYSGPGRSFAGKAPRGAQGSPPDSVETCFARVWCRIHNGAVNEYGRGIPPSTEQGFNCYERNGLRPTGRIGCFFWMPLFEYRKSMPLAPLFASKSKVTKHRLLSVRQVAPQSYSRS
jgi:hypothetical protein